jgi:hypothetical protein
MILPLPQLHAMCCLRRKLNEHILSNFEIWSVLRGFLRQDGLLGVNAATPLGALTVGGAVGDAGRRKIFFTFGRLF